MRGGGPIRGRCSCQRYRRASNLQASLMRDNLAHAVAQPTGPKMIRNALAMLPRFRDSTVNGEWHIVGDSHVEAFVLAKQVGLIDRPCQVTAVGGATAVGLRNPNSVTDALQTFRAALLPRRPGVTPVIHLGEVDCGFVIWYRAKAHGESVEDQLARSISAYFAFVDDLIAAGYPSVVITGASLPTIRDGENFGDVANKRREVSTPLADRMDLTIEYNRRLAAEASSRRLPFIDIAPLVIDSANGLVADNFRNADPTDHHLDPNKTAPLWAEQLKRTALLLS